MTWILQFFILSCFGSSGAALALLLGLHHPAYLSIATGVGIALPLSVVAGYVALTSTR